MENLLNPFMGMMVGVGVLVLGLLALAIGGANQAKLDGSLMANAARGTIFGSMILAGSFSHHMYEQKMFALMAFAVMWCLVGLHLFLLAFFKGRQWIIVIPLTIATLFTVTFFPEGTWGMYTSVLLTCVGTLIFSYLQLESGKMSSDTNEQLSRWALRFIVFGFTMYCGTAALLYTDVQAAMRVFIGLTAFLYLVFYQIIKKFDGASLPFGIANAALAAVFILQSCGKLPLELLSLLN